MTSDINTLMNKDPLDLTKDDLKEVVAYFRKQRHLFKNNPGKAKSAPKLTPAQEAARKLDLGDLKL